MNRTNNNLRSQALALVAVLWLIMTLTTIVAVLGKNSQMDSRICLSSADRYRGKWACNAGIEQAVALLTEDTQATDCLTDIWSDNPEDCNDVQLDECTFTIAITDEAGKVNINTATKNQLMVLPGMTEDIADAILDWRDEDSDPQPCGAEAEYYLNLQPGYSIRNGSFQTLRELLLVKGMSEDLLFGEDANGNGLLDANENDGDATDPDDNADGALDKGWQPYLTCCSYELNKDASGQQRLNINSADENKLVDSLSIKRCYAKWITENRSNGFKSIADLIDEKSPEKPAEGDSDQAKPMDLETFGKIIDKITITDDEVLPGRMNINTATQEALIVLLEGNDVMAQTIIAYRQSLTFGMESIADLRHVKEMDLKTFKSVADQICVRSGVYHVNSLATAARSGARFREEAVLDRYQSPIQILYRYQGETR